MAQELDDVTLSELPNLEDEFICPVCMELLIEPTALHCGHTACQPCLAKCLDARNLRCCPTCRKTFHHLPKVDVTLRNAIRRLYPKQYAKRYEELYTNDVNELLQKLESQNLPSSSNVHNGEQVNLLTRLLHSNIFWIFVFILIIIWIFSNCEKEMVLVHKPLLKWSPTDVQHWLRNSVGQWTEEGTIQVFADKLIDGQLLSALRHEDLNKSDDPFKFMIDAHPWRLRAFEENLFQLRKTGLKPPQSLWEYKTMHPKRTLLYFVGLLLIPRTTFGYMYYWDHDDLAKPLMHVISPVSNNSSNMVPLYTAILPQLTIFQKLQFFLLALSCPMILPLPFLWAYRNVNYWSIHALMLTCLLAIARSLAYVMNFLVNGRSLPSLRHILRSHLGSVIEFLVLSLVWHVIPNLILNCVFYCLVFLIPVAFFDKLINEIAMRRWRLWLRNQWNL